MASVAVAAVIEMALVPAFCGDVAQVIGLGDGGVVSQGAVVVEDESVQPVSTPSPFLAFTLKL